MVFATAVRCRYGRLTLANGCNLRANQASERTEALDPELRAFSSDLAVLISNVDTVIQDS